VRMDKLNIKGGSMAIGHPFGATGAPIGNRGLALGLQDGRRALLRSSACMCGWRHGARVPFGAIWLRLNKTCTSY
jgi:acetyl-CoA acetyltransferase